MEKAAKNIVEYIETVEELTRFDPARDWLPKRTLLFRGQSNEAYSLLPAIARGMLPGRGNLEFESNLVEAAKHKLPDFFDGDLLPLDLLALLQHHGIPTRLLDVSESPLAALFFACQGDMGKNGEVIVFETHDDDLADYPICQAIADSYRFANICPQSLSCFCDDVMDQKYFLSQRSKLRRNRKTKTRREAWIKECCEKPMFVHASSSIQRQSAQSSRYILFPNRIIEFGNHLAFEQKIDELPKTHEVVAGIIKVPSDAKQGLLASLELLDITEGSLFPDNIDKICNDLKRKHIGWR